MVSAVSEDLPRWANVLAVVAGFVVVVGTLALLNRARGKPWYRRPDTIGLLELSAFVLVPPLLPLVFGLDAATAGATIAINVGMLLVVFLVVSYGLLPMTRWAVGRLIHQIANVANLMIRSLPLLLIFTMFMFVNAEMWRVATDISGDFYAAAILLLVVTGSLFMVIRLPQEVSAAGSFDSWPDVEVFLEETPLQAFVTVAFPRPPLTLAGFALRTPAGGHPRITLRACEALSVRSRLRTVVTWSRAPSSGIGRCSLRGRRLRLVHAADGSSDRRIEKKIAAASSKTMTASEK